jgi:phthalate 4,5-cis-dihydrodiol dehydrogenase
MAGGVMVSVIAKHPRLRLIAAADLQPALRKRFESDFGLPTETNVAALAARSDIDVLYIATPHQFHAEHSEVAAERGKHVVVEKPMSLSLADCDRMISASKDSHTVLVVGHTHSFDPAVTAICGLIRDGTLGRPILLNGFNYTNFLYRPRRPEELDPALGGGVLWNQLPHQLDSIRLIVGQPVRSVRAMTAAIDPARRADGCCAAFIEFVGGTVASLVYSGYDRFDSDEWYGWVGASGNAKQPAHSLARRTLAEIGPNSEANERQNRWSYGGDALRSGSLVAHPHFGHLIVGCEFGEARFAPGGLMVYDAEGAHEINLSLTASRPGHVAVWDELCAAVFDGVSPLHSGTFARGTVELCLAIAESARTRRERVLAT